jgi:hypothetical protein
MVERIEKVIRHNGGTARDQAYRRYSNDCVKQENSASAAKRSVREGDFVVPREESKARECGNGSSRPSR